jgi:hypothetical protein
VTEVSTSDLLIISDCVPVASPDWQGTLLKGQVVLVGCPKFDDAPAYLSKLTEINVRSGTVDQETANAYVAAFSDAKTRANIQVGVKFLLNLTFSGVPPNWVSVSLLRDLIPWSGQMLYELMEKMQALLDAFKGILDEIKLFIDLLIRKINVLEEFIKFLFLFLKSISCIASYR